MPEYYCECCDFSTKIKYHMNRHCETKKHHKNVKKMEDKMNKVKLTKEQKERTCQYCDKEFKTKSSRSRHESKSCKLNPSHPKYVDASNFGIDIGTATAAAAETKSGVESMQGKIDQLMERLNQAHVQADKMAEARKRAAAAGAANFQGGGAFYDDDSNHIITGNDDGPFGREFQKNMDAVSNMGGQSAADDTNNQIAHPQNGSFINKTRITINGEEICENPMEDFSTRRALMVAFGNPFFKHNLHFVPLEYFKHDMFRLFFNTVHNLEIEKPTDQEIHDSIYNPMKNCAFNNGFQNVFKGPYGNAVVTKTTDDGVQHNYMGMDMGMGSNPGFSLDSDSDNDE
jgi:hypothetical protein